MSELQAFWNWHACRMFIEEAIKHYKQAPGWFTSWLDDLYIRLGEQCGSITLDEIQTLAMLAHDGVSWEAESLAVNRVYKLFDRLGRDTTGIAGY